MNSPFIILYFAALCCFATVNCKHEARIIGGSDAPASSFRYAAAIYIQTADSRFFCGGALLNQQWIITSGHCANGAELFTIQLGSTTLNDDDPNRVILATSEYVLHPDFDPEKIQNDLALIKLRLPITYNEYIQPIELPPSYLNNNSHVTAIGWGQTSDYSPELSQNLQYVDATILSNVECQGVYGNQITDNMACVEGNYNEGTCTGDTGGPLTQVIIRYVYIVGVASFISGNGCESTDPSGYTRTFAYVDWINSTINS